MIDFENSDSITSTTVDRSSMLSHDFVCPQAPSFEYRGASLPLLPLQSITKKAKKI
ncbi:MAG: hypothetical protein VW618_08245 [Alphaproteobacteria bacterium]